MTFISVLLLAIALSIIQIGTIYNKGMTLREVNQAGRTMSDDVRRNFMSSKAVSLTSDYITHSAGGRLCLGDYTYIWNFEDAITKRDTNVTTLTSSDVPVRFVKVPDPGKGYCVRSEGVFVNRTILEADESRMTELLKQGDRTLSIHQFSVNPSAEAVDTVTQQQLYELSFVIGTGDVNALTEDRRYCAAPGTDGADFNYCAVQQFTIVIKAGSAVN